MPTKKHPIPAYLDDSELEKLKLISEHWGCSLSSAIKRLIREKKLKTAIGTTIAV